RDRSKGKERLSGHTRHPEKDGRGTIRPGRQCARCARRARPSLRPMGRASAAGARCTPAWARGPSYARRGRAMSPTAWQEALAAAEAGRPARLAALIRDINHPAAEMIAAYIENSRVKPSGRPLKRNSAGHTDLRERQADAYERYWQLIEEGKKA